MVTVLGTVIVATITGSVAHVATQESEEAAPMSRVAMAVAIAVIQVFVAIAPIMGHIFRMGAVVTVTVFQVLISLAVSTSIVSATVSPSNCITDDYTNDVLTFMISKGTVTETTTVNDVGKRFVDVRETNRTLIHSTL